MDVSYHRIELYNPNGPKNKKSGAKISFMVTMLFNLKDMFKYGKVSITLSKPETIH